MRDRLGWSTQSALNFSRVFELFAKSKKIVDFEALTIDASSLYRIAAPSTSPQRAITSRCSISIPRCSLTTSLR